MRENVLQSHLTKHVGVQEVSQNGKGKLVCVWYRDVIALARAVD